MSNYDNIADDFNKLTFQEKTDKIIKILGILENESTFLLNLKNLLVKGLNNNLPIVDDNLLNEVYILIIQMLYSPGEKEQQESLIGLKFIKEKLSKYIN